MVPVNVISLLWRGASACRRGGRTGSRVSWTLIACSAFLLSPAIGGAGEALEGEIIIDQRDQRRVELKRALLSASDVPTARTDRRRLSADERDLLGRELREAMAAAYDKRSQRDEP